MKAIFVLTAFALFWEASSRICPDSSSCSSYETCCPTSNGYGCCPTYNANCCNDYSCCPSGYRCTGTPICVGYLAADQSVVECSNGTNTYYCPPSTKCCTNERGTDGCCLFSDPVLCEDGIHYCPHGTQCDKSGNTCVGSPSVGKSSEYALSLSLTTSSNEASFNMEIPWLTKSKPLPKPERLPSKHRK